MTDQPLLSVIVPIYNVESYLEECLKSIIAQTYDNLEILLVNDGSTDSSLQIAKEYALNDDRIKLYSKNNGGLSDARNYGLERIQGEYLTFIDSDDVIIGVDLYKQIMALFQNDASIDAIQFSTIYDWQSDKELKKDLPPQLFSSFEEILNGYFTGEIHVACWDKVYRRNVFDYIRFPLNQVSEDIAIMGLLSMKIGKLFRSDIGYYEYRYREGSITHSTLNKTKIVGQMKSINCALKSGIQSKKTFVNAINYCVPFLWNHLSLFKNDSSEDINGFKLNDWIVKIDFVSFIRICFYRNIRVKLKSMILLFGGVSLALKTMRLKN